MIVCVCCIVASFDVFHLICSEDFPFTVERCVLLEQVQAGIYYGVI